MTINKWKFNKHKLVTENCLILGHYPKLTSQKIATYLLGTRGIREIFKLYELRYLVLRIYPLIHNFFYNPRLNSKLMVKNKVEKSNISQTISFFWFLCWSTQPSQPKSFSSFFETLNAFYHVWPLSQWISSLLVLIFLYWIAGSYYNKLLSDRGGWLKVKTRIGLIVFDLAVNLALGLYYMNHRETLVGIIMMRCPIAISPIIFLCEMVCVYLYYRYYRSKKV